MQPILCDVCKKEISNHNIFSSKECGLVTCRDLTHYNDYTERSFYHGEPQIEWELCEEHYKKVKDFLESLKGGV